MHLLPIHQTIEENTAFLHHPECKDIQFTLDFYERVGFHPPWIGYYAQAENNLVGAAGFKGPPRDGQVEIAYGIFPAHQGRGMGIEICRQLVLLARQANPSVRITARTDAADNYSTRILQKNNFICLGTIQDEEDGEVWEWLYQAAV